MKTWNEAQKKAIDALRERAKRAEAKLADATVYCSGEWPCEASTAAAYEERRANNAEAELDACRRAAQRPIVAAKLAAAKADVARLREHFGDIADNYARTPLQLATGRDVAETIRAALAATEPK